MLAGCGGGEAVRVPEPDITQTIVVTSSAFDDGHPIPRRYTCRGTGQSPQLSWSGIPAGTTSLAVVVSDPDAPGGTFIHWLLYDMPPRDGSFAPGAKPAGAREASNSAGRVGWYPPCPPSGTHRYRFTVYALGGQVGGGSTQDILDRVARLAMARGTLTGLVTADQRPGTDH
jgi:Raf kinase inhibitor-like YbhB/YbcL family protein